MKDFRLITILPSQKALGIVLKLRHISSFQSFTGQFVIISRYSDLVAYGYITSNFGDL